MQLKRKWVIAMTTKHGNALWQSLSGKKNTTPNSVRKKYKQEAMERLAAAICESAVNDYRDNACKMKLLKYKLAHHLISYSKYRHDYDNAEKEYMESLHFIKSPNFEIFGNVDHTWALEELNSQIDEYDPEEVIKGGKKK